MGESSFDQRGQYVGQQFNADRQEFVGKRIDNEYVVENGQMIVNHHVDYVDAERYRAVVDEYVALGRLLDLAVEARKIPENGRRRKGQRRALESAINTIRDAAKETVPLAFRLDAVLELGDWAASFSHVIIKITGDAVGVAVAQVTGRAMSPAEADHLATWPTSASLQHGAIYLLDDFRAVVIKRVMPPPLPPLR